MVCHTFFLLECEGEFFVPCIVDGDGEGVGAIEYFTGEGCDAVLLDWDICDGEVGEFVAVCFEDGDGHVCGEFSVGNEGVGGD